VNNENEQMKQNGYSGSDDNGKKSTVKVLLKIALVAAIFGIIFYLIYFSVQYSKANFILSNQDITSAEVALVQNYKVNDKIYFFLNRHNENLSSNLLILEIEFYDNKEYRHYKQISYELEKDYPKLSSYIPSEYFRKAGKYRIKVTLDGKIVATTLIDVQ
jgi:hypothetical protein